MKFYHHKFDKNDIVHAYYLNPIFYFIFSPSCLLQFHVVHSLRNAFHTFVIYFSHLFYLLVKVWIFLKIYWLLFDVILINRFVILLLCLTCGIKFKSLWDTIKIDGGCVKLLIVCGFQQKLLFFLLFWLSIWPNLNQSDIIFLPDCQWTIVANTAATTNNHLCRWLWTCVINHINELLWFFCELLLILTISWDSDFEIINSFIDHFPPVFLFCHIQTLYSQIYSLNQKILWLLRLYPVNRFES